MGGREVGRHDDETGAADGQPKDRADEVDAGEPEGGCAAHGLPSVP
jgi:hypothetical protein